ncbi:zeta toxin family protein [Hymenobacter weizhouensis]|uniref:zeta toxin family protein n=1 Tax=Hymenobacter sp. YIM 151500-1 TaxID=2987689 RepID=UPI002227B8D5|nr:zeta toxin family protein [Hymenobacter sp. YIM 151500-1]UYZ61599.1 zeta toxin family protein [Hymenobacter sp. YIM 151500-1]
MDSLKQEVNLGVIVNADEIEAKLKAQHRRRTRVLNLHDWSLSLTQQDLEAFVVVENAASQLQPAYQQLQKLRIEENVLLFTGVKVDSYLASRVAEFLRYALLTARQSFTFETVMSHPSKLAFLRDAQTAGFRTYLYFVATEDPEINVGRVRARVQKKGHDVARDKIISRYARTLDSLFDAVRLVNRAFIFDNSYAAPQLIAEIEEGKRVDFKTTSIPAWVDTYFRQKALRKA